MSLIDCARRVHPTDENKEEARKAEGDKRLPSFGEAEEERTLEQIS